MPIGLNKLGLHGANSDPSFEAPLRTSIILKKGIGSPTFARACTKIITDFEGNPITIASNEVGFEGARRVQNLLSNSNNFNSASWAKESGVTCTNTTSPAPDVQIQQVY